MRREGTAQETAPEAPEAAPAPAEEPEPEKEITFSKKVITERDIIEANRDGVKVIRITERNILTALAKDAASARNIRLVREYERQGSLRITHSSPMEPVRW